MDRGSLVIVLVLFCCRRFDGISSSISINSSDVYRRCRFLASTATSTTTTTTAKHGGNLLHHPPAGLDGGIDALGLGRAGHRHCLCLGLCIRLNLRIITNCTRNPLIFFLVKPLGERLLDGHVFLLEKFGQPGLVGCSCSRSCAATTSSARARILVAVSIVHGKARRDAVSACILQTVAIVVTVAAIDDAGGGRVHGGSCSLLARTWIG
mmetsp:Transcript_4462/g.9697  ORF Transcript_4462/g.9697 Transcript_4462/m.9697 type:complete len:209 (-) Transcript_4462:805-1431(-)